MLAVVGAVLFVVFLIVAGSPEKTSASENAARWAAANSALARFIGAGLRGGAEGIESLGTRTDVLRIVGDFRVAVARLEMVNPPDEQAPMHRALLPIYQDMYGQMEYIVSALSAGDALRAELEWYRLALLVEEAGATTAMLSLDSFWVVVGNTGGRVSTCGRHRTWRIGS